MPAPRKTNRGARLVLAVPDPPPPRAPAVAINATKMRRTPPATRVRTSVRPGPRSFSVTMLTPPRKACPTALWRPLRGSSARAGPLRSSCLDDRRGLPSGLGGHLHAVSAVQDIVDHDLGILF